jgi:hypothetical protein
MGQEIDLKYGFQRYWGGGGGGGILGGWGGGGVGGDRSTILSHQV